MDTIWVTKREGIQHWVQVQEGPWRLEHSWDPLSPFVGGGGFEDLAFSKDQWETSMEILLGLFPWETALEIGALGQILFESPRESFDRDEFQWNSRWNSSLDRLLVWYSQRPQAQP